MIRLRDKRNQRLRRATRQRAPRDHGDEPLRIKDGVSALSIKDELLSLEARKAELQSRLDALEIPELVHPRTGRRLSRESREPVPRVGSR